METAPEITMSTALSKFPVNTLVNVGAAMADDINNNEHKNLSFSAAGNGYTWLSMLAPLAIAI